MLSLALQAGQGVAQLRVVEGRAGGVDQLCLGGVVVRAGGRGVVGNAVGVGCVEQAVGQLAQGVAAGLDHLLALRVIDLAVEPGDVVGQARQLVVAALA